LGLRLMDEPKTDPCIMTGLLMLRLVALYKSKPIIVWLLYIALFVSYGATFGLLFRAQFFYSEYLVYSDYVGLCITTGRSPTLSGVFYAPLGYEIILFGLTIYHAWKDYRTQSRVSDTPLLKVMYRGWFLLLSAYTILSALQTVYYSSA
ncbi:3714_t:CDS:2, partial [Acaulospora colombiana]